MLLDEETAQIKRFNGTVAIFYNPITQVDSREWDSIKEFGGPYHPLSGEYRCDDPEVVRRQLHWIRRAGVDVIVYDVYGFKTWNITDLPKDKTLPLLVSELSRQEGELRKLQLIIWLEKWDAHLSEEEYRYGLDYVQKNLAGREFYYRYREAPLVLTYFAGQNPAFDVIEKEYGNVTLRRVAPFKTDVWSYVENYPQTMNREWMPVNPGFDGYMENAYMSKYVMHTEVDVKAVCKHGPVAAALREDGRYFTRQLLRARKANPDIIFVSGWNDWQCCLQIEPAVEYEFKYIDLLARLLGRDTETRPYRQS